MDAKGVDGGNTTRLSANRVVQVVVCTNDEEAISGLQRSIQRLSLRACEISSSFHGADVD